MRRDARHVSFVLMSARGYKNVATESFPLVNPSSFDASLDINDGDKAGRHDFMLK